MIDNHRKNLKFQMENNELLIQIATMLNLVREDVALNGWNKKHDKIIEEIIEDMKFIYNNCEVSFRWKNRN